MHVMWERPSVRFHKEQPALTLKMGSLQTAGDFSAQVNKFKAEITNKNMLHLIAERSH